MQIRQIDMTPKKAQQILNKNTHNRHIRVRKVEAYARDMAAGRWDNNGETIKIAKDGTLLDGQHRLLAVVKSDVIVPMVVISDLEPEVQATVDTGAKRNFGDQLALDGIKYSSNVGAITRRLVMHSKGQDYVGGVLQPTEPEMRVYYENHKTEIDTAAEKAQYVYMNLSGGIPARSVSGFLYVLMARKNKQQADEFFDGLATGENLKAGMPVLALRRKFLRLVAEGGPQNFNEIQAYMVYAWNLTREGKTAPRYLHAPKGGWGGKFPKVG